MSALREKSSGHFYYSSSFTSRDGIMYCENIPIFAIQQGLEEKLDVPSPVFIYSKSQILENVKEYKEALTSAGIEHLVGYSVKANYNPHVVELFKETDCGATTVSGNEILLALQVGIEPEKIFFNGTGKQIWELKLAVENGCFINVDSTFDLQHLITVCHIVDKEARVMLRINPNIDVNVQPYLATGIGCSKFGLDKSALDEVLVQMENSPTVKLVGLHCHLGSTIKDSQVFSESVELLLKIVVHIKNRGFTSLRYMDIGGGLGIDYEKHKSRTQNMSSAVEKEGQCTVRDLIESVRGKLKKNELTVILEPGRSLVGNACILATKVLGCKENQSKRYLMVDGSMTEVIRPSLYGAYHHIELTEVSKHPEPHPQLFDVVGPVCESSDFLGQNRLLPQPHEGCGLAVFDTGAYCGSMASNYNMRMRPAEVLVDKDNWTIIRQPDSFAEIMKPFS